MIGVGSFILNGDSTGTRTRNLALEERCDIRFTIKSKVVHPAGLEPATLCSEDSSSSPIELRMR